MKTINDLPFKTVSSRLCVVIIIVIVIVIAIAVAIAIATI